MSRGAEPADTSAEYAWRRRSDPRLPAYLIAGFGALIAAITIGVPALAVLGAPFLTLAAIGLLEREPAQLAGSVALQGGRVIEGDVVAGEIRVQWEGEAELEVMLSGWHGVLPVDPAPQVRWALPPGRGPAVLPFQLQAQAWGVHGLGHLWVRARRPGGLLLWERKLAVAPALRVLPNRLRLDRLLKPAEPRAVSGVHLSRLRGDGTDFAELRPYQPGDPLRSVSWATSARFGKPWVAVHHLERTGTVLLLLDAFFGRDRLNTEALARAARVAWAVASAHLHAQDRVGLLAHGRTTAWLPPRGGRRARWLLLEELLSVGGAAEDARRARRPGGRVAVPGDALIVGITDLAWPPFLRELLRYRRAGHTAVALVIETSDLLPETVDEVDAAARRIRLAQRDQERYALDRGGVPTALVGAAGVAPAITSLRRRMSAVKTIRAGTAR